MKSGLSIGLLTKEQCKPLLAKHHYLSNISRGFKSGFNVGLFRQEKIIGVCIFTGLPVAEIVSGCFGLPRSDQSGFFELSRLVLEPAEQSQEHNLASWFVSRSIKMLRKQKQVRAILSYADDDFHSGTVYAACNFRYFGLTDAKKDFWIRQSNGSYKKHSRGKIRGLDGEWRPRSRKHRFLMIYDKNLQCKWKEEKWSSANDRQLHSLRA